MSHRKPSEKRKGLGAGIIAFGVVFALFSLLFRPHTIGAFALATALSLFAGAVIRVMAQGLDVSPTVKTPESLQKVQGNTGDPDVDALLEKGRGMIAEIRAENERIPDSALSDQLEKLENLCAEVFRAVYDKPAKAPQIRKFMDYYLPTTLKMVRGFRTLDERGILDLNTLVETNQSLIDTINEVMKIQDEGRAQRVEAEKQLVTMENELKQKLLELKH